MLVIILGNMDIIIQLIINSIIAGAIYSLIALGFNLIFGVTKFFNLAHGMMAAVGGYLFYFFDNNLRWNFLVSVIFAVFFSGVIGLILERVVYFPLRKKDAPATVLLVASIGVFTVLQALIVIVFGSRFQTLEQNIHYSKLFEIAGGIITQTQVVILGVVFFTLIAVIGFLKFSIFGRAVRAISDDIETAKIIGINTDKIIGGVFFIGSSIAGIAGILVGFDTGIEPIMGLSLLFTGAVASIIGGNIYGSIMGAFFLAFIENFAVWKVPGEWKDVIAFIVLILFLIYKSRKNKTNLWSI